MSAPRVVRVLVVDDSVVVRKIIGDALSGVPGIEVVATAANGRIALTKIPVVRPDVVTLDVEMPEMGGLETLVAIRASWPRLPVVMFSSLTERAASITLQALSLGASDYATKPNATSMLEATEHVRAQLVPKVLCFGGARTSSAPARMPTPAAGSPATGPLPARRPGGSGARVEVVAIGSSTGGPNALAQVLAALPAGFPVPIAITQHMPPLFTRMLAERLTSSSSLTVVEATDGAELRPGVALVAPGDFHMEAVKLGSHARVRLHQGPLENSCRPSVDPMFRSLAEVYGPSVLAVVLTGMGKDGTDGAGAISRAGGSVLAQDEASSVVWGMPGFVVKSGLADAVLPLAAVGAEIALRVASGRGRPGAGAGSAEVRHVVA